MGVGSEVEASNFCLGTCLVVGDGCEDDVRWGLILGPGKFSANGMYSILIGASDSARALYGGSTESVNHRFVLCG